MRFKRTRAVQLSPIKEVEIAASRIPGTVSLAQGIPSFDTPEVIKAYVKEKLDGGEAARYSLAPGLIELRELIAEHLLREGMRYDPDGEVLVTAGSIEAIAAALTALTEPGQEVIIPSPSYASYQQVIRMAGAVPRFAPLDEERNFDLDVEAIARRITPRTAAIFYCNPNNPTGTIYSREQSLRLMELAERHDLMILTDEVYKDFCYTPQPYFTPAQEEAFRERVVRIFSFSKAYAMTGWRVGYLHGSRRVVGEVLKAHDAMVTCAPVISQHAAYAALAFGGEAIAAFREAYRRRRDRMLGHLDACSHVFDYQRPNGAYFAFPRVKDAVPLSADSRALAFDLLERAGVALVPGVAFGPTGESHLRLSFGREEADIEEAFARLRDYFDRARQPRWRAPAVPAEPAARDREAPAAPGPLRRRLRRWAVGYLGALARLYLWRRHPGVVAIAGNRGKTVHKRTLTGLLEQGFVARSNPRSYNTEIGLPLAVLGLEIDPRSLRRIAGTLAWATWRALASRERVDWLVLELGTRRAGDMAGLLRTVRPHWAVVTPVSSEEGDAPEAAAVLQREVAALCAVVPPERLLMSLDDPLLRRMAEAQGLQPVELTVGRLRPEGRGYLLHGEAADYRLGPDLVGDSALLAAQAAVLLGERLGLSPRAIQAFLAAQSGAGTSVPADTGASVRDITEPSPANEGAMGAG